MNATLNDEHLREVREAAARVEAQEAQRKAEEKSERLLDRLLAAKRRWVSLDYCI